jgi:hypothetical protein
MSLVEAPHGRRPWAHWGGGRRGEGGGEGAVRLGARLGAAMEAAGGGLRLWELLRSPCSACWCVVREEEEKEEREKKKEKEGKEQKKGKNMEIFPNLKIFGEKNKRQFMKLVKIIFFVKERYMQN